MNPLLSLGLAVGRNALLFRPPGSRLPASPDLYRVPVREEEARRRIRQILETFFTGIEVGLRCPGKIHEVEATIPELLHPFFHEGRAMGIAARSTLGGGGFRRFSNRAQAEEGDRFLFLKYVGLGFWLGFRHPRRPERVESIARRIGKYGDLVLDGYGFKLGFFDVPRDPRSADRLFGAARGKGRLSSHAAAMAANGLGRSRWFFAMDSPQAAFEEARRFQDLAPAVLGGLGLASAFTFPDDLTRAYSAADILGDGEKEFFLKGVRIALYVRDVDQPEFLQKSLRDLPEPAARRAFEDLEVARQVGAETRSREDFIAAFHQGCLNFG